MKSISLSKTNRGDAVYKVIITDKTGIQIRNITLSVADIKTLAPICVTGLPGKINEDMRDKIEMLVCLAINPLRSLT